MKTNLTAFRKGVLAAALISFASAAQPALIDLSPTPLASSASGVVKPNIAFMLDSSGSMAWTHAPDEAQPFAFKVGYQSSWCNSMYYNPNILYVAPKKADGTDYPNSSFTAASIDGFQSATTVNLATSFQAFDNTTSFNAGVDTAHPADYYVYKGTLTQQDFSNTTNQFYTECSLARSATPVATITFSGSNSTAVNTITVNGTNIMAASTTSTTSSTTLASLTAAQITAAGYSATASGSTVTINGPASVAGVTPVITTTPPLPTATVTFSGSANSITSGITVNGTQIMSGATAATTSASTMATNVAGKITVASFSAVAASNVVTITGPASATGASPVVNLGAGSATATITVGGNGSTSVTSITVNGTTITTGATSSNSNTSTVASRVDSAIGAGGCTATSSGTTVTVTCPISMVGATPVINKSGNMTFTSTAFAQAGSMSSSSTPFTRSSAMSVTIQPFTPFKKVVVSATSGPGGTDERTNFANWYTYYRTRILMMKAGAGRAFATIGSNYRVGFMTIYSTLSTTDAQFQPISDFDQTQKNAWYSKFYAMDPSGGTPLRTAMSNAGRYFAHKTGGPDPVQYSCQQNFLILTTDGYWNAGSAAGVDVNNGTLSTSQDSNISLTPRPQYDGGLAGSRQTLADVAAYYYNTDLRSSTFSNCTGALGAAGGDVCVDNVPVSGQDNKATQHMTTFTLGLGVNGQLKYTNDYLTGGSADFNAITAGSKDWPSPTGDTLTTIDDLWHAAVNGHGQYFSAKDPDLLVSGLRQALAAVATREASGAAAATSNLEPVAGDNFAYIANYRTVKWDGDVQARTIDLVTGLIQNTAVWSAQDNLDSKPFASRRIYTFLNNTQVAFAPGSFNAFQKSQWFTPTAAPSLSQSASWTATDIAAATPDSLINYLRGDTSSEERTTNASQLYRLREHILGDIINGKPVFAKVPPFNYTENNYQNFKTSVSGRQGVVFVAANDGMLHAFNSDTGDEMWAYVPSFVLPNLKALADDNYGNAHQFSVDGSPTVSDIWTGSQWKTLLVGGLNDGGKGYYAIDVTDTQNPTVLWEYTDTNMGFTFGNPVIGKLADGTWVVAVTSGYNNADGVGRLYILDAATGALKFTISTGTGSAVSPSGLGKIAGWTDDGLNDNTIQRIYGGDMFGNLWRFDINDIIPPSGREATRLANFAVGAYVQPITTKPELGLVKTKPVVFVGTGRYLGASDVVDQGQQSLYAIRDDLQATGVGNPRTSSACTFVQQTLSVQSANTRTTSQNAVDMTQNCGWFIDFNPGNATPGERITVDPNLQLGVLAVATNIPENSVCTVGGSSFLYFFDFRTGQFVPGVNGGVVGTRIGNAIAVGLNTYKLPDGRVVTTVTTSDDKHPLFGNPTLSGGTQPPKRVMWRELMN